MMSLLICLHSDADTITSEVEPSMKCEYQLNLSLMIRNLAIYGYLVQLCITYYR